jgi:hypothetical protein
VAAVPSQLYGCQGELRKASGRLVDWSFAGYRGGEEDIPDLVPQVRQHPTL